MKNKRTLLSILLVMTMMMSSLTVQAEHSKASNKNQNNGRFSDVEEKHWAYEYIEIMSRLNIIDGYGDGKFYPNEKVTKEQFSKMLVLTLKLDLINPSTPSFSDVGKSDWSYKYVETAKGYLTGFGNEYRPKLDAEREDMAYAIIKALDISIDDVDLSVLDDYSDKDQISTVLIPYVAKAIEEGIMIGSDGKFSPRGTLIRAEAATLLGRLITTEKVIYDDTKVIYDDASSDDEDTRSEDEEFSEANRRPTLEYTVSGSGLNLNWSTTSKDDFKYYKVVFSTTDDTPVYPEDGYLTYISDVDDSDYIAFAGSSYNGGDFDKITAGTKYFVSITAVYSNGSKYYPSETITVTLP